MIRVRRRLWALVRSRRLAVWLIGGITVYAMLATLIPLGAAESPDVQVWASAHPVLERFVAATGMHLPFRQPLFVIASVLLLVNTAGCSWERTVGAMRALGRGGRLTPGILTRLNEAPTFTVRIEGDTSSALHAVARVLRESRQRSVVGPKALTSFSFIPGFLGSPLFHWGLVAIFLFVGAGQLTRSEGYVDVVSGGSVVENEEAYLGDGPLRGPLFGGYTGLTISVTDVERGATIDGIARGDVPTVRVQDGGVILAEGRVYPNNPLSVGSLVIHRKDSGPGMRGTLVVPGALNTLPFEVPFPGDVMEGTVQPRTIRTTLAGEEVVIELRPIKGARVAVRILSPKTLSTGSATAGEGESAKLPGGMVLTVDELTSYARLTVVNDWSVPYIYAALVLASIGMTIGLVWPPREVYARVADDTEGRTRVNVVVIARLSDPAYALSLRRRFDAESGMEVEAT